jgi:hypothetical protein
MQEVMSRTIVKFLNILAMSTVLIGLVAGCSTTQRITHSQRTAVEQLLISGAVTRSLSPAPGDPLRIPLPPQASVVLETAGISTAAGVSADQDLLQHALAGWLGQQGYFVQKEEKNAAYRVHVIVDALGTELGETFVGMPPVQSLVIPFSLPELSLYKAKHQTGYVKFHMNVFEILSGRLVGASPIFIADTYYSDYTILFLISFISTNLEAHPRSGVLREVMGSEETQEENWKHAN